MLLLVIICDEDANEPKVDLHEKARAHSRVAQVGFRVSEQPFAAAVGSISLCWVEVRCKCPRCTCV